MTATAAGILAGADRAAFATALGQRLRRAGVPVDLSRLESFVRALSAVPLLTRSQLYWAARISLVRHRRELAIFDEVFAAVFDAVWARDPHARRQGPAAAGPGDGWSAAPGAPRSARSEQDGGGLPWITRPALQADDGAPDPRAEIFEGEPMPSALAALAATPFDQLDPEQLHLLAGWLTGALARWPTRRTRRTHLHRRGGSIDLRATLRRSRATGWEPIHPARRTPVRARRRVILLCDVSRSMQPYTAVYLHLMRAAALGVQAEVFAFGTDLTRLTPALSDRDQRSGPSVVEKAAARVSDRSGGTRIGHSLHRFLRSRTGAAARGAVLVIASDGWDADPPAELEAALSRLHRRARRVIWLNPRVAEPGFAPLTGAMAAALPYCDELLPGHTLRALQDVVEALTRVP